MLIKQHLRDPSHKKFAMTKIQLINHVINNIMLHGTNAFKKDTVSFHLKRQVIIIIARITRPVFCLQQKGGAFRHPLFHFYLTTPCYNQFLK